MTSGAWDHHRYLDLRGLACPLPVLKTRKALMTMASGQRLLIEATDPLAAIDVPHFLAESGHRPIETETDNGVFRCLIERN